MTKESETELLDLINTLSVQLSELRKETTFREYIGFELCLNELKEYYAKKYFEKINKDNL